MNKQEFLSCLRRGLSSLPQEELNERLTFYSEMIDDRMEEGLSEEEAVRSIGSVESIIGQIMMDRPQSAQPQKRRLQTWQIVLLLCLSAPIWGSLLAAAVSVVAALFSAAVSLWVAPLSLVCSAFALFFSGLVHAISHDVLTGLSVLSAGLVCGGLSIFAFLLSTAITKYVIQLTKKLISWVKQRFAKKEAAQ